MPLPPDHARINQVCAGQLHALLNAPHSDVVVMLAALRDITEQMTGERPLRNPPLPRRLHPSRPSTFEAGSSSRVAEDEPTQEHPTQNEPTTEDPTQEGDQSGDIHT